MCVWPLYATAAKDRRWRYSEISRPTPRQMIRILSDVSELGLAIRHGLLETEASWGLDEVVLYGVRGDYGHLQVTPAGDELEFGAVTAGGAKEKRITLRNTGPAPMRTTFSAEGPFSVRPELEDYCGTMLPQSKETFLVRFAPTAEQVGEEFDLPLRLQLITPGQAPQERTLRVTGKAVASPLEVVEPVPLAAVEFGQVAVGQKKRLQVRVRNLDTSEKLRVRVMRPAAPFFSEKANKRLVLRPGQTVAVPVEFRPTAAGSADGVLELRVEGLDPAPAPVTIRLQGAGSGGSSEGWLEALQPVVDVGDVALDDGIQIEVPFRRKDTRDHTITLEVEPRLPFFITDNIVLIEGDGPAEFTHRVYLNPAAFGEHAAVLRIKEIQGREVKPLLTVQLQARTTKPLVSVTPAELVFPETRTGVARVLPFKVTSNARQRDVYVAGTRLRDPVGSSGLRYLSGNQSLAPGESRDFWVEFRPTAAGTYENLLQVFERLDGTYHVEVPVHGRAVNPPARPARQRQRKRR